MVSNKRALNVNCETPKTIWPVLIHAKRQQLIKCVTIQGWRGQYESVPRISVRLRGLIDTPWLIYPEGSALSEDDPFIIYTPPNPPVTLSTQSLDRDTNLSSSIDVLVNSTTVYTRKVTLYPPTAIPVNVNVADALASFVLPNAREVTELVRFARERVDETQSRLGFSNLTPEQASKVLYKQLTASHEPAYSWEPGPCSLFSGGQMIRLPRRVLLDGEATCVDLALLLCSALEHIQRLPIILGVNFGDSQWHIIPGVRADDNDVSSEALTIGLDHVRTLCNCHRTHFFDPDALVRGDDPTVAHALAINRLKQASDAFVVDVQAAREADIWPLAIADPPRPWFFTQNGLENPVITEHPVGSLEKLANDIAQGQVIALLGNVLDPNTATSREKLTTILTKKANLNEPDFLLAGSLIEKQYGRDALIHAFKLMFSSDHLTVTDPYRAFAQLPIRTVVSFYPDPVLEHVLLHLDPPFQPLVSDDDLATFNLGRNNRLLYLLGGSALSGAGLVLTQTNHEQLLQRIQVLGRGLRERLASHTLFIIGCDLTDLNLKELYFEATKHLSNRIHPIYVLSSSRPETWPGPCHILEGSSNEVLNTLVETIQPFKQPDTLLIHNKVISRVERFPYKYLDYFEPEDASIFFGRDKDIELISKEIMASPSRISILCGHSGVGKTSIVKAGLIPMLEHELVLLASYTRCGTDPQKNVALAMRMKMGIENNPNSLDHKDLVKKIKELSRKTCLEQIVFIDQLEEAFIKIGPPILNELFDFIGGLVNDKEINARVVFVIREDYLGKLANYRIQIPGLLTSIYRLPELSREAARIAIIKPAEVCGYQVEELLVEELLNDLSPDTILPAHLQIVCDRIYRESESHNLTLATYERLGRTKYILRKHLENAMTCVPVELNEFSRLILRTLVTSERTKDLLSFDQITRRTKLKDDQITATLYQLIHAGRLIREVSGEPVKYELSHESLAESVADWLNVTDMRIKETQEILEQEVANAHYISGFKFPMDKLRLIDEYREALDLDTGSIKIISAAFLHSGQLPQFWHEKLKATGAQNYYEAILGKLTGRTDSSIVNALLDLPITLINSLPRWSFPKDAINILINMLFNGDERQVIPIIQIILRDDNSTSLGEILRRLRRSSKNRQMLILNTLNDAHDQMNLDNNLLKLVGHAFVRNGILPQYWQSKLATLHPAEYYKVLFGQRVTKSTETLSQAILDMKSSLIEELKILPFTEDLVRAILKAVYCDEMEKIDKVVRLALLDTSVLVPTTILESLCDMSQERAKIIITSWGKTGSIGIRTIIMVANNCHLRSEVWYKLLLSDIPWLDYPAELKKIVGQIDIESFERVTLNKKVFRNSSILKDENYGWVHELFQQAFEDHSGETLLKILNILCKSDNKEGSATKYWHSLFESISDIGVCLLGRTNSVELENLMFEEFSNRITEYDLTSKQWDRILFELPRLIDESYFYLEELIGIIETSAPIDLIVSHGLVKILAMNDDSIFKV